MAFELNPDDKPDPKKENKLSEEGTKMVTLLKLSMDERILEQGKFLWEDEVFKNCLKGMKAAGMPLPEKTQEVQALIRLILAAHESTKVKRLLDYKY